MTMPEPPGPGGRPAPRSAPAHVRAHPVRGLPDRAVVWLFVTPTILVLLAINIFPLLWTIWP